MNYITISGVISWEMVDGIIEKVGKLADGDLTVIFDSTGGEIACGNAIDLIISDVRKTRKVFFYAAGPIESMAFSLFFKTECDCRTFGSFCYGMAHLPYFNMNYSKVSPADSYIEFRKQFLDGESSSHISWIHESLPMFPKKIDDFVEGKDVYFSRAELIEISNKIKID